MQRSPAKEPLVLSIFPNARGFGYAVFEGAANPVDWGSKRQSNRKPSEYLAKVCELIGAFEVHVLILRDCDDPHAHCSRRTKSVIERIERFAADQDIKIVRYSRPQIRKCFAPYNAQKKDAIARVIAQRFPEFGPRVPPFRKEWMSEDQRMALFDALALALTYYANEHLRPQR